MEHRPLGDKDNKDLVVARETYTLDSKTGQAAFVVWLFFKMLLHVNTFWAYNGASAALEHSIGMQCNKRSLREAAVQWMWTIERKILNWNIGFYRLTAN